MIKKGMTKGSQLKCRVGEHGNMKERARARNSMYSGRVCSDGVDKI